MSNNRRVPRFAALKRKSPGDKRPKKIRVSKAPRRLLVPVDFSDSSILALRHAVDLAKDSGGSLTIVHVVAADYGWLDIGREEYRDLDKSLQKQAVDELRSLTDGNVPPGIPTDLEVRIGRPAVEIVAAATETKSDLIVLSTNGRTGVDRHLFGSVAERVAHLASCPVLLLPPGKQSPKRAQARPAVLRLKHKR